MQDGQESVRWFSAGYKRLDEEQHATAAEAMQNYVTSADLLKQLCQGRNNSSWLVNDTGRPMSGLHALACYLHNMNNVGKDQRTPLQRPILHVAVVRPANWVEQCAIQNSSS